MTPFRRSVRLCRSGVLNIFLYLLVSLLWTWNFCKLVFLFTKVELWCHWMIESSDQDGRVISCHLLSRSNIGLSFNLITMSGTWDTSGGRLYTPSGSLLYLKKAYTFDRLIVLITAGMHFILLATFYDKIISVCHCVKSVQMRRIFWSLFSCIRIEYREIQENTDQKKLRIWTFLTQSVMQFCHNL